MTRTTAGTTDRPPSSWLSYPRAIWLSLGIRTALWLPWPLLAKGRGAADEYWIQAALSGFPSLGAMTPWRLFHFADGTASHLGIERGPMPWFTHPELKVALFRPLTELTHRLDHHAFGVVSTGAYIHNFLWSLALVAVAAQFFARALPPSLSGVALLLLAGAGSHCEPTQWIAARNATISAVFGLAALAAHLDWRERGNRRSRAVAPALFVLSLLGGEVGLGLLAFVLAYEAVVPDEPWPSRLRAGAPYVGLTAIWLAAWLAQGFGTHASGLYLNPLDDPLGFLVEGPPRLLALSAGALMGFPTLFWTLLPQLRATMCALGVLGLAVTASCLLPVWRAAPRAHARRIAWLSLGSAAALVPQSGGALGARSVLVSSIGVSALVAWCLVQATSGEAPRLGWGRRGALALVAVVHLGIGPLNWWALARAYSRMMDGEAAALAKNDLADTRGRHVVVVACADPKFAYYLPAVLSTEHGIVPQSWNVLSSAQADHRLRRTAPRTLELEVLDRGLPETIFERLMRSPSLPLHVGERVAFGVATAEVLAMRGHRQTRVAFAFDRPLEDPSLYFAAWKDGALRKVPVPPVGGAIDLPFEKGPWMP